jgi:hypothetical protein
MLFIVSSVTVDRRDGGDSYQPEVSRAPGEKCPRCWRFVIDAVTSGELAGLCPRCADAVGNAVVAAR